MPTKQKRSIEFHVNTRGCKKPMDKKTASALGKAAVAVYEKEAARQDLEFATKLAEKLFTEGNGRRAKRLLLIVDEGVLDTRGRSGWCEGAVRDAIAKALQTRRPPVERRR